MPSSRRLSAILAALGFALGCNAPVKQDARGAPGKPAAADATSAPEAPASHIIIKDGDRVAFLGDSITAGGASYGAFCRLVVQGLEEQGIVVEPIFAGVPGNKSSDMLLRLDGDVLSRKPDWVVLAVGVNDIWHGDPTVKISVFQPKPGMGVGLEDYKKYVTRIVERTRAAGAKVILTTITPIKEDPDFKLNVRSRAYNAFLHDLAKREGIPIAKLNEMMFGAIAEAKAGGEAIRLTGDGVHPVKAGHCMMAKGILLAMGLTDEEVALAEREWDESPKMIFVGDRQVGSGGRIGGWLHMILDGLNSGREMFTGRTISANKIADALRALPSGISEGAAKCVLVVAPKGDAEGGTPLAEYEKAVSELMEILKESKAKAVVASIPVRNDEPESELNKKIEGYNAVLKEAAGNAGGLFVDINAAMVDWYGKHGGGKLTIFGERFNYEGSVIFSRMVLGALGVEAKTLDRLEKIWDARGSYALRYAYGTKPRINLSSDGHKVLDEISDRFHKIGSGKLIQLGFDIMLAGDTKRNQARVGEFDARWVAAALPEGVEPIEVDGRFNFSKHEVDAVEAIAKDLGIGFGDVMARAFKIGVHAMWTEILPDLQPR